MKKCYNCDNPLKDSEKYCPICGAKQDGNRPQENKQDENYESLMLKYASYLNNEALFKVAWAKEKGLIKSDFPGEAEAIYKMLSLRGHSESMFRYAMMLMGKVPPAIKDARFWLENAAKQGHVASKNYLAAYMPGGRYRGYAQGPAYQPPENNVQSLQTQPSNDVLSGAEISSNMSMSVVEILTSDGDAVSCASGIVVSSNGFVITNAHAVLNEKGKCFKYVHVKLDGIEYNARPLAVGRPSDGKTDSIDIALLFVENFQKGVPAKVGRSISCQNGQKVYLIGNSLGEGICITSGIISDAKRKIAGLSYPYIMTDAAANHGNSGGPLVNEQGEVIGVLVSGIPNAEGMNFAIPIDMVKAFVAYVFGNTQLPRERCRELSDFAKDDAKLSLNWGNVFAGISVVIDAIALVLCII